MTPHHHHLDRTMSNAFIKFDNLEAAVAYLYRRDRVELIIEAPAPAPATYETETDPDTLRIQRDGWQVTAEARSLRAEQEAADLKEQRDRYMRCSQTLETQNAELEMRWLGAAAEASELRNEVERLAALPRKDQSDRFAYREFVCNIAAALGWSTHEISFKEVLQEVKDLKAQLLGARAGNKILLNSRDKLQQDLADTIAAWQKDREEMKRELDAANTPVPKYRMLDVGETIRPTDQVNVGSDGWIPYGATATVKPVGADDHPVGYYRRRIA